MSGSTDTLGAPQTGRTLTLVYWESKRLNSVLIVWFPSPYDLILAACSLRPQLMMQAEHAVREQEVETSMS